MIREYAYAKINLILDVVGKREDGYHNLSSIFTNVDLRDVIELEKNRSGTINLISNSSLIPLNKDNLCFKAAQLMLKKFNITSGVNIRLEKNIPVSAGLGGGSSDAAAVMRAIIRLFNIKTNMDELINIAVKIGADVPYFLHNGTCLVEGIGEKVERIKSVPFSWIILIKPNFGVSTKKVFLNLKLNEIHHPNVKNMLNAIENKNLEQIKANLGNSLEQVAFKLFPKIKKIKNRLISLGYRNVLMSGSGPTLFVLTSNYKQALKIKGLFIDEDIYSVIARLKVNSIS